MQISNADAGLDRLVVNGLGGADVLTVDERGGAQPAVDMFGGAGKDALTGGLGGDMLSGDGENDVVLGRGGNDLLVGGDGDDTLTGGDGDDQVFGAGGNDRMIWNPGDDTDLFEGGDGIDTAEVNGGGGAEIFTATANGTRVRFDRLDPAPFSLDIGTSEKLVVNMNGGDDSFSTTGNLAALIGIAVDGGDGNDTILGSNGIDLLLGGDGNDFVDGQQGADTAFLGAGDDVFQWDPGDGSDTVEGEVGSDKLLFNGSNANETIAISANGARTRFTRDVGAIVMDLRGVETIEHRALGGTDTIQVGDLSGTDVTQVKVDLAGTLGGSSDDGQADRVIVDGTNGANTMTVTAAGGVISVNGAAALVQISNAEASDRTVLNGLGGADVLAVDETGGAGPAVDMFGGAGKDTLTGGSGGDLLSGDGENDVVLGKGGNDLLVGGDGDDTLTGGDGDDQVFGAGGNDRMIWNPGDDTDLFEGGDGIDTAEVNGGGGAEVFTATANGTRVRFDRLDPAPFSLDIGTTEKLVVNMNGGDDSFSATGNLAALIGIAVDGGEGNDTILGSNGIDLLIGGDGNDFVDGQQGNDTALLGAGDDVFQWDPGDGSDTVEGEAGSDKLLFNGSNANEIIAISANGARTLFTRDIGAIVMDLRSVETIDHRALGGTDTIQVGDLSATHVTQVKVDLAGTLGGSSGDGQADRVIVDGTDGANTVTVTSIGGVIAVTGLAALVEISNADATVDRLEINGLGGNDTIDAGGLANDAIELTVDAGAGNDVVTGRQGVDTVLGGDGNDRVIDRDFVNFDVRDGGAGIDTIDYSVVTFSDGVVTIDLEAGQTSVLSGNTESILGFENASGSQGGETIVGNAAANRLEGNGGDDSLHGGLGNDTLDGGSGDDRMFGGDGKDSFLGAAGADHHDGGAGGDVVSYASSSGATVYLDGSGTNGNAALGDTFVDVENVVGGTGKDVIVGDSSANQLVGNDGNDILWGRAGKDRLDGGEDNDRLFGDEGKDVLIGGAGADTFGFTLAPTAGGLDRIVDFEAGVDEIQIDASQFGGGLVAGGSVQLVTGTNPSSAGFASGVFLYDTLDGFLSWDADGQGAGAAVSFARLQNLPTLTAADFSVVP
ncbi:MAG: calcium-binding protein [Bauldia sp.]|nr:calcium-binding protein [Bauldia sp.]